MRCLNACVCDFVRYIGLLYVCIELVIYIYSFSWNVICIHSWDSFYGITKVSFDYWLRKKVESTPNQWLKDTLVNLIKWIPIISTNNRTLFSDSMKRPSLSKQGLVQLVKSGLVFHKDAKSIPTTDLKTLLIDDLISPCKYSLNLEAVLWSWWDDWH